LKSGGFGGWRGWRGWKQFSQAFKRGVFQTTDAEHKKEAFAGLIIAHARRMRPRDGKTLSRNHSKMSAPHEARLKNNGGAKIGRFIFRVFHLQ
jgi:hypothetical protein